MSLGLTFVTGQWINEPQQMVVNAGGMIGGGLVNYQCPSGYYLKGSDCRNVLCDTGPINTPRPIIPPVPQNCVVTPTVITKQELNCQPGSYLQ